MWDRQWDGHENDEPSSLQEIAGDEIAGREIDGPSCRAWNYTCENDGSLSWPFSMLKYKYIFQIKYTEAISSNSTRKLLFEITKMLIAVFKIKFIVLFTIIFGTLSSLWHYGVKFAQNGASTGDTRWACAQNDTPRSSTGATAAFDTHDCIVLVFRFLLLEKL